MVGLIEIKATQPSWGLGLAELGNILLGQKGVIYPLKNLSLSLVTLFSPVQLPFGIICLKIFNAKTFQISKSI